MDNTDTSSVGIKVVSVTLHAPKALKLGWIIQVDSQSVASPPTISNDDQSKQTTQSWPLRNYLIPTSVDSLTSTELVLRVSSKPEDFNKMKYLIGEQKIDFSAQPLSHCFPHSYSVDFGSGYRAEVSLLAFGAPLLKEHLASNDETTATTALKDVMTLFSDANHSMLCRSYLTSGMDKPFVKRTKRMLKDTESKQPPALQVMLIDTWRKMLEVANFARLAQHLRHMPGNLLELIAADASKLFKGNLTMKMELLDALRGITSSKLGMAILHVLCALVEFGTSEIVSKLALNENGESKPPKKDHQRLVTVLFRLLLTYDPKHCKWMADNGKVLLQVSLVLQHWNLLEMELVKQAMEVVKFFDLSCVSRMNELRLMEAIGKMADGTEDLPLRLTCKRVIQQYWPESESAASSLTQLISSYRTTSNPSERFKLIGHVRDWPRSTPLSGKESLRIILALLEPAEGYSIHPSEVGLFVEMIDEVKASYADILDLSLCSVIAKAFRSDGYPLELSSALLSLLQKTRPSEWNDLRYRSKDMDRHRLLWNGTSLKKDNDVKRKLSVEEAKLMGRELEYSDMFTAFTPHAGSPLFFPSQTFYMIRMLWNHPDLYNKVLESDEGYIFKLAKSTLHLIPQGRLALTGEPGPMEHVMLPGWLVALAFEGCTDDDYNWLQEHPPFEEPWSTRLDETEPRSHHHPKSIIHVLQIFDLVTVWGQTDRVIQAMPMDEALRKDGAEISLYMGVMVWRILSVLKKLSKAYSWSDINDSSIPEREIVSANLRELQRFLLLFTQACRSISGYELALTLDVNIIAQMDETIQMELVGPWVTDASKLRDQSGYSTNINGLKLTIFVDKERYRYDEEKERILDGIPRIGLVILLRGLLRCAKESMRLRPGIDGWRPYDHFLSAVLVLLGDTLGDACGRQLFELSGHLAANNIRFGSSYEKLVAIAPNLSTDAGKGDNAFEPMDHLSTAPPRVLFSQWYCTVPHQVTKWKMASVMQFLDFGRSAWNQFMFVAMCEARPLAHLVDTRFMEDFGKISSKFRSMSDEEVRRNWPEIVKLMELYYVPHLLSWDHPSLYNTLYRALEWAHTQSSGGGKWPRKCPNGFLEFLVMLPQEANPQETFAVGGTPRHRFFERLFKTAPESIARKALWIVRREIDSLKPSNTQRDIVFSDTCHIDILPYSARYSMFLKCVANFFRKSTEIWAANLASLPTQADSLLGLLNQLLRRGIFQLERLINSPVRTLSTQRRHNQEYAHKHREKYEPPSFDCPSWYDVSAMDIASHLPPNPYSLANHPFEGDGERIEPIPFMRSGEVCGPDVSDALFLDEASMYPDIPIEERTLADRDIQFDNMFMESLTSEAMVETLTSDALDEARKTFRESSLLPDLCPSILYKNKLLGWLKSDDTPPTPAPKTTPDLPSRLRTLMKHSQLQILKSIDVLFDTLCGALSFELPRQVPGMEPDSMEPDSRTLGYSLPKLLDGHMFACGSLWNFAKFFITGPLSKYDVFEHDTIELMDWIPPTTYWKWLSCIARLDLYLSRSYRVFCGKLTYTLMKHDVENGSKLHESIGEQLFRVVAVFGGMSANPNVNPDAPRLLPSSSKNDPKDLRTNGINEEAKALNEKLKSEVSDEIARPSTYLWFDEYDERVPSYLVHYLMRLVDSIHDSRPYILDGPVPNFVNVERYRTLLSCVAIMIRGWESHCFSLTQLFINEMSLLDSHNIGTHQQRIWRAHPQPILLAIIRDSLSLWRFMDTVSAHKLTKEIGSKYHFWSDNLGADRCLNGLLELPVSIGKLPTKPPLAALVSHISSLEEAKEIFKRAPKVVKSLSFSSKVKVPGLAALPFFVSAMGENDFKLLGGPIPSGGGPRQFKEPLKAFTHPHQDPVVYIASFISHYRVGPKLASMLRDQLNFNSPANYAVVAALPVLLDKIMQESPESTWVGKLVGKGRYEGEWAQSRGTLNTITPARPARVTRLELESIVSALLWQILPFIKEPRPAPEASKKQISAFVQDVLRFDIESTTHKDALSQAASAALRILDYDVTKFDAGLKSNGTLWKLQDPKLGAKLPMSIAHSTEGALSRVQYGVTIVDQIVTVWFEDRPIQLNRRTGPSENKTMRNAPICHKNGLELYLLPLDYNAVTDDVNSTVFCRAGFATKEAIDELTANRLKGIGDVKGSWALDQCQSLALSEGSVAVVGGGYARKFFSFTKPIRIDYDTFSHAMCISNMIGLAVPEKASPQSDTMVCIPLPNEELVVYPCISFYSPCRFAFEPSRQ